MSHNDITGAKIATKAATQNYRDGHDRIFASKQQELCLRCGRTGHTPEDCKMPAVDEERKSDGTD